MPTTARKRHRIGTGGPWGTGLLLLGLGAIAQGVGYAAADPDKMSGALRAISDYLPMWAWGGLWTAAGVYSVWKALRPPQRHVDVWAVVAIVSVWSAAYAVQWLVDARDGDFTRDWAAALAWGMLAGVISALGRCVNPPTSGRRE